MSAVGHTASNHARSNPKTPEDGKQIPKPSQTRSLRLQNSAFGNSGESEPAEASMSELLAPREDEDADSS